MADAHQVDAKKIWDQHLRETFVPDVMRGRYEDVSLCTLRGRGVLLIDIFKIRTGRTLGSSGIPRLLRNLELPKSEFIGSFDQIPRFKLDAKP